MTSHKLQNGDSTTQLFSLLTAEMPGHRASCCPPPNFISSCVRHKHCRSPGSYGHHATQELHVSTRTKNQHDGSDTMLELGSESQLRPHQMQGSAAWHWLWSTCLPHCAQSSHWGRRQLQDLIKNWGGEIPYRTRGSSQLSTCLSAHTKNVLGLSPKMRKQVALSYFQESNIIHQGSKQAAPRSGWK